MDRHRRILLVLGAALLVTTVAYLAVRGGGGGEADDRVLAAEDGAPAQAGTTTTTATVIADAPDASEGSAAGGAEPAPVAAPTTAPGAPPPAPTAGSATTTSARATTTTAPAPAVAASTVPAPPFRSSVRPVTAAELGASWHRGCPVPVEQLRSLAVSYWSYDGDVRTGELVVAAGQAAAVEAAMHAVYDARFPIRSIVPVAHFGGDDGASMRADNTSAFNCRYVAGTTTWSEHSYGAAIDINPLVNPYVKGSTVDPPEGAAYADRSRHDQGMIHADDAVVRAFAAQGWKWGGYWRSGQDYQHFSASGR